MIKKKSIPTILGILILVIGTFAGVFLLRNSQIFKIGADTSASPKNIRVTNVADSSLNVSWTTDKETQGFLLWGSSSDDVSKVAKESQESRKTFTHSIDVSGLAPESKFYYKVNSDGSEFDNGGIAWQVTTGPSLDANKDSVLVSGSVINASGKPEKGALVYLDISGYLLSTVTSDTGNYVFQIGSARTADLKNNIKTGLGDTPIQISIQAPPDGIASAKVFPKSANPTPVITIGQVYDFRNEPANMAGADPNANLSLPKNTEAQSKFNLTLPASSPKPTSVILESINEGETITTEKPQFFGKGPGGSTLTITVHSATNISQKIQVQANGIWSFTVPSNLSPGVHTILISWVDVSGITRTLTRNFVVKAGEVPAFTATGSGATATPTVIPTNLPTNIPTSIPTSFSTSQPGGPTSLPTFIPTIPPTVSPLPVLNPSASPTIVPIPVTGDLTPTLILTIMGLAVIAFSFVVWRVAEN